MLKSPVTPDGREKVHGQQAWLSPWSLQKNTPRWGRCLLASVHSASACLPFFPLFHLEAGMVSPSQSLPTVLMGSGPRAQHSSAESILFASTVLARSFARPTRNIP